MSRSSVFVVLLAVLCLMGGCAARRPVIVQSPAPVSVQLSRQESLNYELGLIVMRLADEPLSPEDREQLVRQKMLLELQIEHDKKARARLRSIIGVAAVLAAAGIMAGWGISH